MKGDNKIGFLTMWKIQAFIARSAVTLHAVMMKHLPRNFLVDAGPSTYSAIPLVCFNLPNVLMQNNGNIPFSFDYCAEVDVIKLFLEEI